MPELLPNSEQKKRHSSFFSRRNFRNLFNTTPKIYFSFKLYYFSKKQFSCFPASPMQHQKVSSPKKPQHKQKPLQGCIHIPYYFPYYFISRVSILYANPATGHMIKFLSHHADEQEKKELENKGLLDRLCVTLWCRPQKGTHRNVLTSILDGNGICV